MPRRLYAVELRVDYLGKKLRSCATSLSSRLSLLLEVFFETETLGGFRTSLLRILYKSFAV
jgi:hypothetical protein